MRDKGPPPSCSEGLPRVLRKLRRRTLRISSKIAASALASFLCLDGAPLKRVLLLNSYHQGYAWTDDIVRGVTDGLLTEASPVDIDIEYRDSKRYEDTASEYAFALFLSSKFAHTHFDVIVASDDPVVRFLLKFRHRIFGEIPVVFCGVNEYHGSSS